MSGMNLDVAERLTALRDQLASFDGPSAITRGSELDGIARELTDLTAALSEVTNVSRTLQWLDRAGPALAAARAAADRHRRARLTRPISQVRFAFRIGTAHGAVQAALDALPEGPLPWPSLPGRLGMDTLLELGAKPAAGHDRGETAAAPPSREP